MEKNNKNLEPKNSDLLRSIMHGEYSCCQTIALWFKMRAWYLSAAILLAVLFVFIFSQDIIKWIDWEEGNMFVSEISSFFKNHEMFSGILTTIVGLWVSFYFLRPHIFIDAPQLYQDNNYEYVAIRIYNTGLFNVYDLQTTLQSYSFDVNEERQTFKIDLVTDEISILKYKFAKKTDRSYLLISKNNLENIELVDNCEGVRFRVSGTCSFSGVRYVYEKEFKFQNYEKQSTKAKRRIRSTQAYNSTIFKSEK